MLYIWLIVILSQTVICGLSQLEMKITAFHSASLNPTNTKPSPIRIGRLTNAHQMLADYLFLLTHGRSLSLTLTPYTTNHSIKKLLQW